MPRLLALSMPMIKRLPPSPIGFCLAALTGLLLVACDSTDTSAHPPRKPTTQELLAYNVARTQHLPELCSVIDPLAQMKAAWSASGAQISALRSRCYYAVAILSSDSSFCAGVASVKHASLDGSAFSESACRATLTSSQTVNTAGITSTIYIPPDQLRAALAQLGYTYGTLPEPVSSAAGTGQDEALLTYYLQALQRSSAFASQLLLALSSQDRP